MHVYHRPRANYTRLGFFRQCRNFRFFTYEIPLYPGITLNVLCRQRTALSSRETPENRVFYCRMGILWSRVYFSNHVIPQPQRQSNSVGGEELRIFIGEISRYFWLEDEDIEPEKDT